MAITKTIEIEVNSSQANQSIDSLTNSLNKNEEVVKSLKQQYKEAALEVQRLGDQYGVTSKEATEAAKRAADLKDRIEDSNDAIAAFKGEGAFNATAKAVGAVASGFSAVQGALALAGAQSEEFEKTMVRLQGAMALAQGLQGLEDLGRSFQQLKVVAVNAFNGIKAAIGSTGIGLLLIALGAVVTYWDDIKSAVSGVSEEQKKLNADSENNLNIQKGKLDSLSLQENSLRLQGKSEKDILKMKVSQTDQIIKAAEIQLENSIATSKAQTEAAKRNQDILAGVLKFLSLPLTMILKTVDAVGAALGKDFGLEDKVFKGLSSFVFDPKETAAEGAKVIAEQRKALAVLKSQKDANLLAIQNIDKTASDKAAADAKAKSDKAKADAEKAMNTQLDDLNKQSEILAKGRDIAKANNENLLSDLKDFGAKKTAEIVKNLDEQIAAEAAAAKTKEEIAKLEAENKLKMLDAVAGGLSLAADELGASTAAGKIAAVAAASISTYTAIAGQLAAFSNVPVPGYAIAQAIITGATGLLQVKKILAVKTPKSKGSAGGAPSLGGGGSGGTAPAAAPSFNIIGNSGVNQIAQTLGQQQPVQAYVVANSVTTQQALDRSIVQNASLGG
jgi:chromosome segregation ATPase